MSAFSIQLYTPATLQFNVQRCERFDAHQVVQDAGSVRVVGAVVEFGNRPRRILEMFVLGANLFGVLRVDDADGSRKVAERRRVVQIERRREVVGQNPWKHRVLWQIVVRPAGDRVQLIGA